MQCNLKSKEKSRATGGSARIVDPAPHRPSSTSSSTLPLSLLPIDPFPGFNSPLLCPLLRRPSIHWRWVRLVIACPTPPLCSCLAPPLCSSPAPPLDSSHAPSLGSCPTPRRHPSLLLLVSSSHRFCLPRHLFTPASLGGSICRHWVEVVVVVTARRHRHCGPLLFFIIVIEVIAWVVCGSIRRRWVVIAVRRRHRRPTPPPPFAPPPPHHRLPSSTSNLLGPTSPIPPSSEYEPAHGPSERGGVGSFRACWSIVGWAHIPQQRGGAPSRVGAQGWR